MRIPSKPETNIFGFVDPLSREVWFSAFSIMVVIALISLLLDKVSLKSREECLTERSGKKAMGTGQRVEERRD